MGRTRDALTRKWSNIWFYGGLVSCIILFFFFSSRRRHTRSDRDWSSDVCSSDLTPIADDWMWHVRMPVLAYAALVAGAAGLWWRPALGLVLVGAAALFLLYIGIHNSWDAAIYVSVARRAPGKRGTPPE